MFVLYVILKSQAVVLLIVVVRQPVRFLQSAQLANRNMAEAVNKERLTQNPPTTSNAEARKMMIWNPNGTL